MSYLKYAEENSGSPIWDAPIGYRPGSDLMVTLREVVRAGKRARVGGNLNGEEWKKLIIARLRVIHNSHASGPWGLLRNSAEMISEIEKGTAVGDQCLAALKTSCEHIIWELKMVLGDAAFEE